MTIRVKIENLDPSHQNRSINIAILDLIRGDWVVVEGQTILGGEKTELYIHENRKLEIRE